MQICVTRPQCVNSRIIVEYHELSPLITPFRYLGNFPICSARSAYTSNSSHFLVVHQHFGHCHYTHTYTPFTCSYLWSRSHIIIHGSNHHMVITAHQISNSFNVFITFHSCGLTGFCMIVSVSLPIKVFFLIQIFKHKAVLYHHKHVSTYCMYQLHICRIWLKI